MAEVEVVPAAEIDRRVGRGAALLDVAVPGWFDRVDTGTLRMSSAADCVLSQVFALSYWGALDKLFGSSEHLSDGSADDTRTIDVAAVSHGFTLDDGESGWVALTAAWANLIDARIAESELV